MFSITNRLPNFQFFRLLLSAMLPFSISNVSHAGNSFEDPFTKNARDIFGQLVAAQEPGISTAIAVNGLEWQCLYHSSQTSNFKNSRYGVKTFSNSNQISFYMISQSRQLPFLVSPAPGASYVYPSTTYPGSYNEAVLMRNANPTQMVVEYVTDFNNPQQPYEPSLSRPGKLAFGYALCNYRPPGMMCQSEFDCESGEGCLEGRCFVRSSDYPSGSVRPYCSSSIRCRNGRPCVSNRCH